MTLQGKTWGEVQEPVMYNKFNKYVSASPPG